MKRARRRLDITEVLLTTCVIVLLSLNANAMYTDYQLTQDLRTTTSSGSSLAERYLILGSWPASKDYDFASSYIDYPIKTKDKHVDEEEME